jgi:hypothetical protein
MFMCSTVISNRLQKMKFSIAETVTITQPPHCVGHLARYPIITILREMLMTTLESRIEVGDPHTHSRSGMVLLKWGKSTPPC